MRLREHPAIGEGRTDILPADPRKLSVIENYNVRDLTTPEARAELDELKSQVQEHGVRTPLVVRFDGEKIWIVEGHRRHKVALELIAEHKESGGTKGRKIEYVPITAEKPGTSDIDRDFGLETSNSGTRLKPLELANLIYRLQTQRGLPLEAIAAGLGKSLVVIKNHLAMRSMPEPVKEHVREGAISATEAAKLVKNLPAGTDPAFAADLIAKNKEENKRLGVGKKNNHKVTAKTIKRDAPKAEAKAASEPAKPEPQTQRPPMQALTDEEKAARATALGDAKEAEAAEHGPSMAEVQEQIERIVTGPVPAQAPHPQLQAAMDRETPPERKFPAEAMQPPTPSKQYDRDLFAIVAKVAEIAEGFDLNAFGNDEAIGCQIPAQLFKDADRLYRSRTGDTLPV